MRMSFPRLALAGLLALAPLAALAQNVSIDGLPAAAAVSATDTIPASQGSVGSRVTGKVTPSQMLAYHMANGTVFTSSAKGFAPASGGGTTNFLRADGTWAAPASGGGGGAAVPTHPGYISTNWYRAARYTTSGAVLATPDTLICAPLIVEANAAGATTVTATDLGVRASTGQAGASMYLGIYSSSAGKPGTLQAQVTVAPTSTANATATLATPYALTVGTMYWGCALYNTPTTQPTMLNISTADPLLSTLLGVLPAGQIGANVQSLAATTASTPYSGGLPATAPTMNSSVSIPMPLINYKVQ